MIFEEEMSLCALCHTMKECMFICNHLGNCEAICYKCLRKVEELNYKEAV